jgi:hypothetical protein
MEYTRQRLARLFASKLETPHVTGIASEPPPIPRKAYS